MENLEKGKLVFMGGTCNDSLWRDELIKEFPNVNFFNPVVLNWDNEAYQKELLMREHCNICLYVITPRMVGVYSIAEVIDDSNKRPEKTVFVFKETDDIFTKNSDCAGYLSEEGIKFSPTQIKSLKAVGKMVRKNGGVWCENIDELKSLIKTWV